MAEANVQSGPTFLLVGPDCTFQVSKKQVIGHSKLIAAIVRNKGINGFRLYSPGIKKSSAGVFCYFIATVPLDWKLKEEKPVRNPLIETQKRIKDVVRLLQSLPLNDLAVVANLACMYMVHPLYALCCAVAAESMMAKCCMLDPKTMLTGKIDRLKEKSPKKTTKSMTQRFKTAGKKKIPANASLSRSASSSSSVSSRSASSSSEAISLSTSGDSVRRNPSRAAKSRSKLGCVCYLECVRMDMCIACVLYIYIYIYIGEYVLHVFNDMCLLSQLFVI